MAPKHSAEVPSRVPKDEKTVMCLTEKIHVLDTLRLFSYELQCVGHEFNANKATIYIKRSVFKEKHTQYVGMY